MQPLTSLISGALSRPEGTFGGFRLWVTPVGLARKEYAKHPDVPAHSGRPTLQDACRPCRPPAETDSPPWSCWRSRPANPYSARPAEVSGEVLYRFEPMCVLQRMCERAPARTTPQNGQPSGQPEAPVPAQPPTTLRALTLLGRLYPKEARSPDKHLKQCGS